MGATAAGGTSGALGLRGHRVTVLVRNKGPQKPRLRCQPECRRCRAKEIPASIDSKGCDFTISCSDMTCVDHARAVTPYYTPDTILLPFAIREAHLGRLSAQCLVLSREPRRLRAHLFDVKTTSGTSYVTQINVGDAPGSPYRRPVGHKGRRSPD